MGNNSTENTGPVSRQESNQELSALAVGLLWSSEDVFVHGLDSVLEGSELDHGVWYLTEPKWSKSLVESTPAFSSHHFAPSSTGSGWESAWLGGLHTDLQGFHWAKHNISDDFGTSRGDKETNSLALSSLFTKSTSIDILEHLIESELSESL